MKTTVPTIGRDELHDAIREGTTVPLDAQGPGWFERERLPTAVRARPEDLGELEHRLPEGRNTPIAVYCWSESCIASALTAAHLIELGYQRVQRYVGGKREWIDSGLPLEGDE